MKYELIRTHPEYPVTKWAACLDVSTSAYYDWLANKDERDERQEKYTEAIKAARPTVWTASADA